MRIVTSHGRLMITTFSLLTVALLFFAVSAASAQAPELVRSLSLSSSGHDRANSITFSPDGRTLAVGGSAGIYLFDPQSLSSLGYITTGSWARSLDFVPASNTLAAGLFDGTIQLWNVAGLELGSTLNGHEDWVRSISLSADGSLLASASDDNTVRIWDVASNSLISTLSKDTDGVRAVALSPDGTLVAAAMRDNAIRIWNVEDGSLLFTLEGHTDWPRCLAFSPDGSILASGSFDKTIMLWDVTGGALLHSLEGHTSSVLDLAFSPDGKMLASSSVDKSVRLWQVEDGERLQVLRGHSDFVYAVAFSPDGKTIASGGGDNSVFLWDVTKISTLGSVSVSGSGAVVENEVGHQQSGADCSMCHQESASDCRTCHHPRGTTSPPSVVEVRCELCHANGVSLNWCPVFPRSPEAETVIEAHQGAPLPAGVPVVGDGLAVLISSPSNGETLYTKDRHVAPVIVTGRVFSDEAAKRNIIVHLDVFAGHEKTTALTLPASDNGSFKFNLALNPAGGLPVSTRPSALDCANCHDDFRAQGELPKGSVRLVVTATAADGSSATDERWIEVDVSDTVALDVKVINSATGEPVADIPIQAMTTLYEWKTQFARDLTDSRGMTQVEIERLSQGSTTYTFGVDAVVIGGVRYAVDAPVQAVLEPGRDLYPVVNLSVHAEGGNVSGILSGADSTALNLWALQLPYGPLYQTSPDSHGSFSFETLPVSKYSIQADALALAEQGLFAQPEIVDLLELPTAQVSLNAKKSSTMLGAVKSADNANLPFAWLSIADQDPAVQISPVSGTFLLTNAPPDAFVLTASAPGYYSKSYLVDAKEIPVVFKLKLRQDTAAITWGSGQLTVPSETKATVNGLKIDLEQGWVWGQGESGTVSIQLPEGEFEMISGRFAVERPMEGTPWLYVYDGSAKVSIEGHSAIKVESGQMVAFAEGAEPFEMQDSVIFTLHPTLGRSPIPELIEPSITARFENWLAKAGIKSVQIVTFITYIIVLVALLIIPAGMLFSRFRKRGKTTLSQEHH